MGNVCKVDTIICRHTINTFILCYFALSVYDRPVSMCPIYFRCISDSLHFHAGFHWNTTIFYGAGVWSICQCGGDFHLEDLPIDARYVSTTKPFVLICMRDAAI